MQINVGFRSSDVSTQRATGLDPYNAQPVEHVSTMVHTYTFALVGVFKCVAHVYRAVAQNLNKIKKFYRNPH